MIYLYYDTEDRNFFFGIDRESIKLLEINKIRFEEIKSFLNIIKG